MSDNRCGTCAHYKARRKLRKQTVGVCLAPVPECVRDERDDCHSTDGATCKVWARIMLAGKYAVARDGCADDYTYRPGYVDEFGAEELTHAAHRDFG